MQTSFNQKCLFACLVIFVNLWGLAEIYAEDFPEKLEVLKKFEQVAKRYSEFKFNKSSMWNGKANFFSLFYELTKFNDEDLNWASLGDALKEYSPNETYKSFTQEGVNNLKERTYRSNELHTLILNFLIDQS